MRAVGLAPADQHLGAAQPARPDVDDRLEVRHELACLERPLDLGDRIVALAPRQQDRKRKDDDRQKAAGDDPQRAQIALVGRKTGMRGRYRRLQSRSGSDDRSTTMRSARSAVGVAVARLRRSARRRTVTIRA